MVFGFLLFNVKQNYAITDEDAAVDDVASEFKLHHP